MQIQTRYSRSNVSCQPQNDCSTNIQIRMTDNSQIKAITISKFSTLQIYYKQTKTQGFTTRTFKYILNINILFNTRTQIMLNSYKQFHKWTNNSQCSKVPKLSILRTDLRIDNSSIKIFSSKIKPIYKQIQNSQCTNLCLKYNDIHNVQMYNLVPEIQ